MASHNSIEKNLRFKIAFTETNIRWLLGEHPINRKLIDNHKQSIRDAQKKLDGTKIQ